MKLTQFRSPTLKNPRLSNPNITLTVNIVGLTTNLSVNSYNYEIISVNWGDGATSYSPTHTYANYGPYQITVMVSNGVNITSIIAYALIGLYFPADAQHLFPNANGTGRISNNALVQSWLDFTGTVLLSQSSTGLCPTAIQVNSGWSVQFAPTKWLAANYVSIMAGIGDVTSFGVIYKYTTGVTTTFMLSRGTAGTAGILLGIQSNEFYASTYSVAILQSATSHTDSNYNAMAYTRNSFGSGNNKFYFNGSVESGGTYAGGTTTISPGTSRLVVGGIDSGGTPITGFNGYLSDIYICPGVSLNSTQVGILNTQQQSRIALFSVPLPGAALQTLTYSSVASNVYANPLIAKAISGGISMLHGGNGIYANFTGTSFGITVDTSLFQSGDSAVYANAIIDGVDTGPVLVPLGATQIMFAQSTLSSGSHTGIVKGYQLGINGGGSGGTTDSIYTTPSHPVLNIIGFVIDSTASMTPAFAPTGHKVLWFGDSITSAVTGVASGVPINPVNMEATYPKLIAAAANENWDVAFISYAGTGWTANGIAGVSFPTWWNNIDSSTALPNTWTPDAVFIALGKNDSPSFSPTVSTPVIQAMRTKWPIAAIAFVVPVDGTCRSSITVALAAYQAVAPSDINVFVIDPNTDTFINTSGETVDGTHPIMSAHATIAPGIGAKIAIQVFGWTPGQLKNLISANVVRDSRSASKLWKDHISGTNATTSGDTVAVDQESYTSLAWSAPTDGHTHVSPTLGNSGSSWYLTFAGATGALVRNGASLLGASTITLRVAETVGTTNTRIIQSLPVNSNIDLRRSTSFSIFVGSTQIVTAGLVSDSSVHTITMSKPAGGNWSVWLDGVAQTVAANSTDWNGPSGYGSGGFTFTEGFTGNLYASAEYNAQNAYEQAKTELYFSQL